MKRFCIFIQCVLLCYALTEWNRGFWTVLGVFVLLSVMSWILVGLLWLAGYLFLEDVKSTFGITDEHMKQAEKESEARKKERQKKKAARDKEWLKGFEKE